MSNYFQFVSVTIPLAVVRVPNPQYPQHHYWDFPPTCANLIEKLHHFNLYSLFLVVKHFVRFLNHLHFSELSNKWVPYLLKILTTSPSIAPRVVFEGKRIDIVNYFWSVSYMWYSERHPRGIHQQDGIIWIIPVGNQVENVQDRKWYKRRFGKVAQCCRTRGWLISCSARSISRWERPLPDGAIWEDFQGGLKAGWGEGYGCARWRHQCESMKGSGEREDPSREN